MSTNHHTTTTRDAITAVEDERARWHAAAARATTTRIERLAAAIGADPADLDQRTRIALADVAHNCAGNTMDVLCGLLSARARRATADAA